MGLKAVLSATEHTALPEAVRAFYKTDDKGNFNLDVDGMVAKERLDEFRTNNINLLRDKDALAGEVTTLKKKFEGIDPEEVKALKAKKKPDDADADEARLKTLLEEHTKPLTEQITTLGMQLKAEQARADDAILNGQLVEMATTARVKPTAIDDFKRRARDAGFTVKGGTVVAEKNGTTVLDPDNPGAPLTLGKWTERELASATHLVQDSTGGGAAPGGTSGGRAPVKVLVNPSAEEFGRNLKGIADGTVQVKN